METLMKSMQNKSPEITGNLEFPIKLVSIHSHDTEAIKKEFHWHDELQILYIERGSMDVHLENKHVHLSQDNCLLINQSVMHYFDFQDDDSLVQLFLFHPAFLFGFNNSALNAKYLSPIIASKENPYYLLDQTDEWRINCLRTIKELIEVNQKEEYGFELITKALLCDLWLALLKHLMHTDSSSTVHLHTSIPNTRVRTAIMYIEEHYTEPITLDEIANSVHVSKSECCRSFKKALQMTPFEYLMKYRIYIASVKIASGDPIASSISGLAANVGFNNPSYFNKVFKEFIGCTPTQYRKDLDHYNVLSLLPTQQFEGIEEES